MRSAVCTLLLGAMLGCGSETGASGNSGAAGKSMSGAGGGSGSGGAGAGGRVGSGGAGAGGGSGGASAGGRAGASSGVAGQPGIAGDAGAGGESGLTSAKEICAKLDAAGCAIGNVEQCELAITNLEGQAAATGCANELETLVECRMAGTTTCDAQGTLQSPLCLAETSALNACL